MADIASASDHDDMAYAVIWNENDGLDRAGKLELAERGVSLQGSGEGCPEARRDVRFDELAGVYLERCAPARNSWEPALVLLTGSGDRVAIGSLEGVGALHELAGAVARQLDERDAV